MKRRFVCVWKCLFFSSVNTHLFDLKFVAFCPKFSEYSYLEFQEKTISGEFFRNFAQTKANSTKSCKISPYFLAIFIMRPYCAEKIHTITFICCLHPGKEARP